MAQRSASGKRRLPARLCGAKTRTDSTCKRPAGWGTDHPGFGQCKLHFGRTASAKAAAVKQQAAVLLAQLDVAPVENPLAEMKKLAGQALAWRDQIAERVNLLTSVRYEGGMGTEQLRSEVALFERAMDRCASFLMAMAKLNIDERLARVDERTAEIMFQALQFGLETVGMEREQQERCRAAVAEKLIELQRRAA
jgi:hypothetical protein